MSLQRLISLYVLFLSASAWVASAQVATYRPPATTRAGAFTLSSAQAAAAVITLPAGACTVRLREAAGLRGDAPLEVHEVD